MKKVKIKEFQAKIALLRYLDKHETWASSYKYLRNKF